MFNPLKSRSRNRKCAPIYVNLGELEENATNMLETYQELEGEIADWPIRVTAERVEFDVDSWFSYRVMGR
jgi:hypothetical protein